MKPKKISIFVFQFLMLFALLIAANPGLSYSETHYQAYDDNQDYSIGDFELLKAIDDWVCCDLPDFDLLKLIDFWAAGSYCWDSTTEKYETECLIDIAGMWRSFGLASGPGAPWWERGDVVIKSDGTFTASTLESDGTTGTPSGTLQVSPDGVITIKDDSTIEGSIDSGKTVMTWTDTWSGDAAGTVELKVLLKKATIYSSSDLAGKWKSHNVASGPGAPWWGRGDFTIKADGELTGIFYETDDGDVDDLSATFNISPDGIVTMAEDDSFYGAMDAGKTVMVFANTWSGHKEGTTEMMVMVKKSESYTMADMTGNWKYSRLITGPSNLWSRGTISIDSNGDFTVTGSRSNGLSGTDTGKFTMTSDGVITIDGEDLSGDLDLDKSIVIVTDTLSDGSSALQIFTRMP